MNWFERQGFKFIWRRMETKMPFLPALKRYLPLVGVAFIGVTTLLQYLGLESAASALSTLGGLLGANEASPVTGAEFAAAAAAVSGVVLKVLSLLKKK